MEHACRLQLELILRSFTIKVKVKNFSSEPCSYSGQHMTVNIHPFYFANQLIAMNIKKKFRSTSLSRTTAVKEYVIDLIYHTKYLKLPWEQFE